MGQCTQGMGKAVVIKTSDSYRDSEEAQDAFDSGDQLEGERELKLLLLGTPNSGKSTVYKQFQLEFDNGFSDEDREEYRNDIIYSLVQSISLLIRMGTSETFSTRDLMRDSGLLRGMNSSSRSNCSPRVRESTNSMSAYDDEGLEEIGEEDEEEDNDLSSVTISISDNVESEIASIRSEHGSGLSAQSRKIRRARMFRESNIENDQYVVNDEEGPRGIPEKVLPYSSAFENFVQSRARSKISDLNEEIQVELSEKKENIKLVDIIRIIYDNLEDMAARDELENRQIEAPLRYLREHLHRIAKADFIPSDYDILQCRKRTYGKPKRLRFKLSTGRPVVLIDAGAQTPERSKLVAEFNSVDAILYVVGLDQYAQKDKMKGSNKLKSSLGYLKRLAMNPEFAHTNILVFLNKVDLFTERLGDIPLNRCFAGYEGNNEKDDALKYIQARFEHSYRKGLRAGLRHQADGSRTQKRAELKFLQTQAIDTTTMKMVLLFCQNFLLDKCMADVGIVS